METGVDYSQGRYAGGEIPASDIHCTAPPVTGPVPMYDIDYS